MKPILLILLASSALAAEPDQAARWREATVNPKNRIALDVVIASYQRNEWRYQQTANARPGTIQPIVICAFHWREADANWKTNLGQGDSLQRRTVHVPKGRIPDKSPPYTWEVAAEDALFVTDHMDKKDWTNLQSALTAAEGYNGFGYRRYGIPSPYLFAGTSIYTRGKFSSDGHFDPRAIDQQLGCVAIWKWAKMKGIKIPFAP